MLLKLKKSSVTQLTVNVAFSTLNAFPDERSHREKVATVTVACHTYKYTTPPPSKHEKQCKCNVFSMGHYQVRW